MEEGRSAREIWEAALGELQVQVSKSNYRTWLEKTIGLAYDNGQFVIGVPTTFIAEYLEQNQRSLIEKTLIGITQQDTRIQFHVNGRHHEDPPDNYPFEEPAPVRETSPLIFNSKYTFDAFVVGSCNRLAYAAALGVAENPGQNYNPLFIYGGPGLGKTHLLYAIGQVALSSRVKVLYVSAEQFTNEFINAIQHRKTDEFRNKYRSVDMLLIDDIHFINGKGQTEECFVHTFNELHNANHQIVITSDRSPKDMSQLAEQLRSRFEWGLIVDIQPPDFETRLAILQTRTEREGITLAPEVLEFIANQSEQNIRELEGCLNRVTAYAKLMRTPLTPRLTAEALKAIGKKAPLKVTPKTVIESVASSFQLAPADLMGRKRDKETALARQIAMYLLREETRCSLAQIGQELGGRDHSTVIHAYRRMAGDIEANPSLRRKINEIRQSWAK